MQLLKLNIGFVLVVFCFLRSTSEASSQSLAQLERNYGFESYIFGYSPKAIKKMKPIDCTIRTGYHDKISCYDQRSKPIKNPWDFENANAHFTFFDEQLMLINIRLHNEAREEGFEEIAQHLIKLLGAPNTKVVNTYEDFELIKAYGWIGTRVKVELRLELYLTNSQKEYVYTSLLIYSLPIFEQFQKSIR